jgi:putative acetyltransferase
MYCPECRSEYRAGFTTCSDCGLALVETLPLERGRVETGRSSGDRDVRLEKVFETDDGTIAGLAQSVLNDSDIPFIPRIENGVHEIYVPEHDAEEASTLLEELKSTEIDRKLLDDAAAEVALPEIRSEHSGDENGIRVVHERAFRRRAEADLVELLRENHHAAISLVAVSDSEIVGHITFSPVTVASAFPEFRGVGLAPLAVLPEFQRNGIGSKLIHDGLEACRSGGYNFVCVLGAPEFYGRFGFVNPKHYGLTCEYGDDAFMVMELAPEVLRRMRGVVRYGREFSETGL